MAGRLTEEQVTKTILIWLELTGWEIVCFDFPQSGTGLVLHPNSDLRESTKNKGAIIPDIVAVKNNVAVFFENKDRYVFSDFEKVNELRMNTIYSEAIDLLLRKYSIQSIYYGIGLPFQDAYKEKTKENLKLTDFVISVEANRAITVNYEVTKIFID